MGLGRSRECSQEGERGCLVTSPATEGYMKRERSKWGGRSGGARAAVRWCRHDDAGMLASGAALAGGRRRHGEGRRVDSGHGW